MIENIMELKVIEIALRYQIISAILAFAFILIFLAILINLCSPRKSQEYRKLLIDMYVAGKIKKLANKEDINLANEEKNFNLWCKKKRLEYSDLDRTIEEEMKEKIAEEEPKVGKPTVKK